jgi:predicted glycoside hydrolase/deacetylase ChbG (UPF0249 family)
MEALVLAAHLLLTACHPAQIDAAKLTQSTIMRMRADELDACDKAEKGFKDALAKADEQLKKDKK